MQVGGAIVDSGNFDWNAYGDKYHGLTQPDDSYHGVVYTEHFGKSAFIAKLIHNKCNTHFETNRGYVFYF